VETFTGRRVAVIHRRDDVETKWVLAPDGMVFTAEEIMAAVYFQEQYFDSYCVLEDAAEPVIVRADASNEEDVIRIRLDCLRAVNHLPKSHVFPAEFVAETRDFLRHADQTTLLACDGDTPIACATLCCKRCIPTPGHPTGRRAHIMNVYVAEGYRRQGIGKQLMLALHEEAASRGVTEITLDATDVGRKLYEAIGYRASDECMYFDVGHPTA
jgi:ribosomal protein S18 acetylase RimI-like enzyme